MHFNFHFTAVQTLWTLTFAALLVLLVVLLGRERTRRFPWFTASIVLVALRLLASRMLFGKMAAIPLSAIFISLADLAVLVGLLVLVEMARRAFAGAKRTSWAAGAAMLLLLGAAVLLTWGQWPGWKALTADSALAFLRLMQLVAQKGDLLLNTLTVGLGLLVVVAGRRFHAGWRSHTQRILLGLSTAALSQLAVEGIWELIAMKALPHSQAEYERIVGLRDKLFNANSAVYIAVVIWWIVCLWIDEPATATPALATASPALALEAQTAPVSEEASSAAIQAPPPSE